MNKEIIDEISNNLNIKNNQIEAVLKLLEEGNTIPFIARYRKEATGALDEEQIRQINEYYEYQISLLKRKETVIKLIDEKGMLTDEIKNNIMSCKKLVEVDDIYAPYKEKKKTKASSIFLTFSFKNLFTDSSFHFSGSLIIILARPSRPFLIASVALVFFFSL